MRNRIYSGSCIGIVLALAACDGGLLVVDAAQGVEAQTVANAHLAARSDLPLVPVVNKIDMEKADPDNTIDELNKIQGLDASSYILASAKEGIGTEELLEAIVSRIPPPGGKPEAPLQALVFDSSFDLYQGVVVYLKVVSGTIRNGDRILLMSTGTEFEVSQVGVFKPKSFHHCLLPWKSIQQLYFRDIV